jgi:DNA replication protein
VAGKFEGFPEGKVHLTPIPAQFFSELLPEIDDLYELKLTLYVIWRLDRMEQPIRYLRLEDAVRDERFMNGMGNTKEAAETTLPRAFELAVRRGTLLQGQYRGQTKLETLYFLNSPKGRAAMDGLAKGSWQPSTEGPPPVELAPEPPNIFRLYEENIGPLTPMLAEALREAEREYPPAWLEDAIQIAVKNNKRNWNYIQAILRRWQREGRDERKDRRDAEEIRHKYSDWETDPDDSSIQKGEQEDNPGP